VELQLLVQAARRSMTLITACLVLGAGLGVAAWRWLPAGYEASAVLVMDSTAVTVPGQEPFSGDPERYVTGELESLRSHPAAEAAAHLLDPAPTASEVVAALEFVHVTGSDVVTVTAREDTADAAVALANAVADSYIARREEATQSALDAQRAALEEQAAEISDRLATETLSASLASALQTQYAEVSGDLAELSRPGAVRDATRVVDEARDAAYVRPFGLLPIVVGGAALAGLVGVSIAVVRAVRRPRVPGEWRVEELTGRPVEAVFRRVGRRSDRHPGDSTAAPARRLVTLLDPDGAEEGPMLVAVCDASARSGRSSVAGALATQLATAGRRVVSVAPGRRDLPAAALTTEGSSRGWQRADLAPGLTVVSHPEPEGLTSGDFLKALPEWSTGADVVLVDAGSLLDSTFAGAAVRASGRVVLVVPLAEQLESDLRLALEVLASAGDARRHVVVTTP